MRGSAAGQGAREGWAGRAHLSASGCFSTAVMVPTRMSSCRRSPRPRARRRLLLLLRGRAAAPRARTACAPCVAAAARAPRARPEPRAQPPKRLHACRSSSCAPARRVAPPPFPPPPSLPLPSLPRLPRRHRRPPTARTCRILPWTDKTPPRRCRPRPHAHARRGRDRTLTPTERQMHAEPPARTPAFRFATRLRPARESKSA